MRHAVHVSSSITFKAKDITVWNKQTQSPTCCIFSFMLRHHSILSPLFHVSVLHSSVSPYSLPFPLDSSSVGQLRMFKWMFTFTHSVFSSPTPYVNVCSVLSLLSLQSFSPHSFVLSILRVIRISMRTWTRSQFPAANYKFWYFIVTSNLHYNPLPVTLFRIGRWPDDDPILRRKLEQSKSVCRGVEKSAWRRRCIGKEK